jgi:hypothetical protein
MIESIIAEIDVEISWHRQFRELLVNDGPKRGCPTETASVSPIHPFSTSLRREFRPRMEKSGFGNANSDDRPSRRKRPTKAPKRRHRDSKSKVRQSTRTFDRDREQAGALT